MGSIADIPEYPMIFSKAPTAVIGPDMEVENHSHLTNELDYEGEIAVIIGRTGKAIKKEEAYDYVFGYTLVNDMTARNLQRDHKQFLIGKSLDTTCPMGPYITHKSLVKNPDNLYLKTKVNGEIRQSASTEQFIFDIPTIIETLSKGMTLEAGDIIATGTPAGVGSGFNPPKHLKPGDEIEITVEELGVLRNKVKQ
jgi:2-keto-4-pentenoate hydratase/2-oxohepta-3-ene-1,7-dioic acid hydratase in catechol pathway